MSDQRIFGIACRVNNDMRSVQAVCRDYKPPDDMVSDKDAYIPPAVEINKASRNPCMAFQSCFRPFAVCGRVIRKCDSYKAKADRKVSHRRSVWPSGKAKDAFRGHQDR